MLCVSQRRKTWIVWFTFRFWMPSSAAHLSRDKQSSKECDWRIFLSDEIPNIYITQWFIAPTAHCEIRIECTIRLVSIFSLWTDCRFYPKFIHNVSITCKSFPSSFQLNLFLSLRCENVKNIHKNIATYNCSKNILSTKLFYF